MLTILYERHPNQKHIYGRYRVRMNIEQSSYFFYLYSRCHQFILQDIYISNGLSAIAA